MAKAIKPDYALGTHVAPLGLSFSGGAALAAPFTSGAKASANRLIHMGDRHDSGRSQQ